MKARLVFERTVTRFAVENSLAELKSILGRVNASAWGGFRAGELFLYGVNFEPAEGTKVVVRVTLGTHTVRPELAIQTYGHLELNAVYLGELVAPANESR